MCVEGFVHEIVAIHIRAAVDVNRILAVQTSNQVTTPTIAVVNRSRQLFFINKFTAARG
jgi:hypothetical protein